MRRMLLWLSLSHKQGHLRRVQQLRGLQPGPILESPQPCRCYPTHNGNAIIVNVSALVQLLFYFGVFSLGPVFHVINMMNYIDDEVGLLNASWVEARLVDGVGNHVGNG